jgi:hypothetical protein
MGLVLVDRLLVVVSGARRTGRPEVHLLDAGRGVVARFPYRRGVPAQVKEVKVRPIDRPGES